MSQSLEQPAPPWGEQAWQRLPARGTQPVPAWLPRLPTFPRCHPLCPLPPPSQQPSRVQDSWHQERVLFSGTPGCPSSQGASLPATQEPPEESTWHQAKENPQAPPTSLEASSSPGQTGHPDTLAPRSCPPRALGQSGSLWRQRPCGGPPVPALGSRRWGCCSGWLPPLLPELSAALVLSFHPTPGLHGAPSQPLPLQAGSPLCRHLL